MQNLPELEDSKKSLRFAIIQTLGITLLVLLGIMVFSNYWVKSTKETEKNKIQNTLIEVMTLVRNTLEPDIVRFRTGSSSRVDAIESIERKLRTMTYTDIYGENYIFLVDYDGYILVQPYQPWLENKNHWNMQDENGKYLIQDILQVARSNERGFTSYYYKPPNLDNEEEKLSYVIDIPELQIVIGTGMYMRLYYEGQTKTIQQLMLWTILIACLILVVTLSALRRINLTSMNLEKEIIKRNKAQQHLYESEMNLRAILNSMSDALIIQDSKGNIFKVNERALEMYGCTQDQIVGMNIRDISSQEEINSEKLAGILSDASSGKEFLFEYVAKRLDNQEEFYVEVALRPVFWYGQNLSLAVVRDIQNRKFIERELLKNKVLSEHAEAIGNYGTFSLDLEKGINHWSKGVYQIFQRDENLPAPLSDEYHMYIHPDDLPQVIEFENQPRQHNKVYTIEHRIIRGDKEVRTILLFATWISIEKSFLVGSIRDITDQKAAIHKINHEIEKLASLRSIDAAILERTSPEKTLEMICSIAVNQLNVDGAIILSRMAKNEISKAFVSRIDTPEEPLIASLLEKQTAAVENLPIKMYTTGLLEKLNQIPLSDRSIENKLCQSVLPLSMNKKICGYIQVISLKGLPDDQEWTDYFHTLAGQTSLAIENVTLIENEEVAYNELHHAYDATIAGWSKALELRDEETKGHSDRVMYLACLLAKSAEFPQEKMTDFRRGVLLHDIGKMGIPDRILLKPGPLSDEEWVVMRQHPVFAYDLLSNIPYLKDSLEVPYLHHERWDGSGYPRGLKEMEIPLAARIFAIVDVWDALISDRPYRNGWKPDKIRQYLSENKGIMFDPQLVDKFLEIMKDFPGQENSADEDDKGN